MHQSIANVFKILNHNIVVHLHSSPSFVMEIAIGILMIVVHTILINEISNFIIELNVPPLKVRPKNSKTVLCCGKRFIKKHPDFGVNVIFKENAVIGSDWNTISKINAILSTSLSEFFTIGANKTNGSNKVQHVIDEIYEEEKMLDLTTKPKLEKLYDKNDQPFLKLSED